MKLDQDLDGDSIYFQMCKEIDIVNYYISGPVS